MGLACASCMQGLSGFPQMRLQAMDQPCLTSNTPWSLEANNIMIHVCSNFINLKKGEVSLWNGNTVLISRSNMAQFEYDESGGTSLYFLVSFYALVLFPLTYYIWPSKEKKGESYFHLKHETVNAIIFKSPLFVSVWCIRVHANGCQILHFSTLLHTILNRIYTTHPLLYSLPTAIYLRVYTTW